MMPGPPKECNAMFRTCAMPYLRSLSDEQIVSHAVHVFGMSESALDQLFRDEMNAMTNPTMAPYAKESDCLLQITAKAGSVEEAEEMMRPVIDHVCSVLGDVVFGIDLESVEERVMQLLREKKMTFSAAESCTGGEIAKRFTDIAGASEFFLGGVTTYTNGAKSRLLGIDPALIEEKGAVSFEVAKEMAERVRALMGSDMGVGVTGLAGPDGDGVHEVGTVFVALATADGTFVRELHVGDRRTRSYVRRVSGNYAFDMMRRHMQGLEVIPNEKLRTQIGYAVFDAGSLYKYRAEGYEKLGGPVENVQHAVFRVVGRSLKHWTDRILSLAMKQSPATANSRVPKLKWKTHTPTAEQPMKHTTAA